MLFSLRDLASLATISLLLTAMITWVDILQSLA